MADQNKKKWIEDIFNRQKWEDKWRRNKTKKIKTPVASHNKTAQYNSLAEIPQKPFIAPANNHPTPITNEKRTTPPNVNSSGEEPINQALNFNAPPRQPNPNAQSASMQNVMAKHQFEKQNLPSNSEQQTTLNETSQHLASASNDNSAHQSNQSQNFYQPILNQINHNHKIDVDDFNRCVPLAIAKEIKSEKLATVLVIAISACCLIASAFFAIYYFTGSYWTTKVAKVIHINMSYVPNGWFLAIIAIISFGVLWYKIYYVRQINHETNRYYWNLKKNIHRVPQFILNNYRKIAGRCIIYNWIGFTVYILGFIVIGILLFLNQYQGKNFTLGFWSLGKIPSLNSELLVVSLIMLTVFILQIYTLVSGKRRKANLVGYYGYEIISEEEMTEYRKRINRLCLIWFFVFIIVLFVFIMIPLLIVRRKKNKKWTWPWQSVS